MASAGDGRRWAGTSARPTTSRANLQCTRRERREHQRGLWGKPGLMRAPLTSNPTTCVYEGALATMSVGRGSETTSIYRDVRSRTRRRPRGMEHTIFTLLNWQAPTSCRSQLSGRLRQVVFSFILTSRREKVPEPESNLHPPAASGWRPPFPFWQSAPMQGRMKCNEAGVPDCPLF